MIYSRRFNNNSSGSEIPSFSPLAKRITILLIVIFVADLLFKNINKDLFHIYSYSMLSLDYFSFDLWQMATYYLFNYNPGWSAGGAFSFGFDILIFWLFSSRYESSYGSKEYLRYFLLISILTGAFCYLISLIYYVSGANIQSIMDTGFYRGSHAPAVGFLIATLYLAPEIKYRIFGLFALKMKYLVFIYLLVLIIFANGMLEEFFILVGASIVSFLYLQFRFGKYAFLRTTIEKIKTPFTKFFYKRNVKKEAEIIYKEKWEQEKVDELLEKISSSGMDSLDKKEIDFLNSMSEKIKKNKS